MTTALRAPLLWLVLPFCAGIAAADAGLAPSPHVLAGSATVAALVSLLASRWTTRLAHCAWALGLAFSVACFGAAWLA